MRTIYNSDDNVYEDIKAEDTANEVNDYIVKMEQRVEELENKIDQLEKQI